MSTCLISEKRDRTSRHFGLWCTTVSVLLIFFGQSVHAQLAPPAGTVRIESIEAIGSGCPPGTFVDSISGDQLAFTLAYSEYTAEDGPEVPRLEARKNCNIILDITYPIGWTFAIFAVDFRGFADLENNTVGTVAAQYFFQGQSPQIEFERQGFGPIFDNYEIRDEIATIVAQFGPCGGGKSLNINTEVRVQGEGALTADTTTGSFEQVYALVWQQC